MKIVKCYFGSLKLSEDKNVMRADAFFFENGEMEKKCEQQTQIKSQVPLCNHG